MKNEKKMNALKEGEKEILQDLLKFREGNKEKKQYFNIVSSRVTNFLLEEVSKYDKIGKFKICKDYVNTEIVLLASTLYTSYFLANAYNRSDKQDQSYIKCFPTKNNKSNKISAWHYSLENAGDMLGRLIDKENFDLAIDLLCEYKLLKVKDNLYTLFSTQTNYKSKRKKALNHKKTTNIEAVTMIKMDSKLDKMDCKLYQLLDKLDIASEERKETNCKIDQLLEDKKNKDDRLKIARYIFNLLIKEKIVKKEDLEKYKKEALENKII